MEWLASLGMSEYAQRFTENDIDVSVLRHLTDQDLKELGISLGHRRKMLAAIAELAGNAPSSPAAPAEPAFGNDAERRQLTVMFIDLSARQRFRLGSIPKICEASSALITNALRK